MAQDDYERHQTRVGRRHASYRAAPAVGAAVAGVVALIVGPRRAADGFFSTTAQVLPVLLLALALEARPLGALTPRGWPDQPKYAIGMEWLRACCTLLVIAALFVAELISVSEAVVDDRGGRGAWFVFAALTAGLAMVSALAFVGPRPRVTIEVDADEYPGDPDSFMLVVGIGNHYGDVDVDPTLNLLIPATHSFMPRDDAGSEPIRTLTTDEHFPEYPDVSKWRYVFKTVTLRRGDHLLYHARIDRRGEKRLPVVVRLDHGDLRGGRFQHDTWVAPPKRAEPESGAPQAKS